MSAEKKEKTKYEIVKTAVAKLAEWGDTLTHYLEVIQDLPDFEMKAGNFYTTINGSLVMAVMPYTACQCGMCKARQAIANGQMGLMGPFGTLFSPPTQENAAEEPETAPEDHQKPTDWVFMVVRGGHGIAHLNGTKAGEKIILDANGKLTGVALDLVAISETAFSSDLFAMMGMVIAKQTQARFTNDV